MRFLVITTWELAPAYRLAGTATEAPSSAAETEAMIRELLRTRFEGVIAVHRPFLEALPSELVDGLADREDVLLIGLPAGEHVEETEAGRIRLQRLLREAVGYEITLDSKGA